MNKNHKMVGIVSLAVIFLVYIAISYLLNGKGELVKNDTESIFIEEENMEKVEIEKIVVEIKGEVINPNVYYMEEGSIIEDLIKEAGGITEEANLVNINRAKELINHECIVIPNNNENVAEKEEEATTAVVNKDGKININTATLEELDKLPGIGSSKAADIINYREGNNGFKSIEEIKNVSGIGDVSFEKIKEKITI